MKTLFIDCNDQLAGAWQRVIAADDPPIVVNRQPFERGDLARLLADFDICVDDHSYMPTEIVCTCPRLRHIVFLGTGAASYMNVAELAALGISVHTIKGYGDIAVAEHTIALMFACARDVARMDRALRAGTWRPLEGVQLFGKTIGIVGLGGIGAEVVRLARGIGMNVLGWNRTPRPDVAAAQVGLDELLERSDVVSIHLALNDDTRGLIDRPRIARMKPGAMLINTARGALVDEGSLVDALSRGTIRHAGLDVFHAEPLAANHPLKSLQNVTLSAHAAFRTPEASTTLLRRAIDIVRRLTAPA